MEAFTVIVIFGFFIALIAQTVHSLHQTSPASQAEKSSKIEDINEGQYHIVFFRQSGEPHRQEFAESKSEALYAIQKVFNRAKIYDDYSIDMKGDNVRFIRSIYNHMGRQEGKRIGGAIIVPAGGRLQYKLGMYNG